MYSEQKSVLEDGPALQARGGPELRRRTAASQSWGGLACDLRFWLQGSLRAWDHQNGSSMKSYRRARDLWRARRTEEGGRAEEDRGSILGGRPWLFSGIQRHQDPGPWRQKKDPSWPNRPAGTCFSSASVPPSLFAGRPAWGKLSRPGRARAAGQHRQEARQLFWSVQSRIG